MSNEPFFIAFEAPHDSASLLQRFVLELAAAKAAVVEGDLTKDQIEQIVADPKWFAMLDAVAMKRLADGNPWSVDAIVNCIFNAEYELLGVEYANRQGRIRYDPFAYPFGGTDPLKALIELCGGRVTQDSFDDWHEKGEKVDSDS